LLTNLAKDKSVHHLRDPQEFWQVSKWR